MANVDPETKARAVLRFVMPRRGSIGGLLLLRGGYVSSAQTDPLFAP